MDINRFIANLIHQFTFVCFCTKVCSNQVARWQFITFFFAKKIEAPVDPLWLKKKSEEKFVCPNPISGWCKFNQFFCVAYPTWWTAIIQKWCALEKESWRMPFSGVAGACVRMPFSFFLSICPQCGAPASLAS